MLGVMYIFFKACRCKCGKPWETSCFRNINASSNLGHSVKAYEYPTSLDENGKKVISQSSQKLIALEAVGFLDSSNMKNITISPA